MNIMRVVRWISPTEACGQFGVRTDYQFFGGRVSISSHFPGFETWALEFAFRGSYWVNLTRYETHSTDKSFSMKLRLGAVIVSLRPVSRTANEYRFVSIVEDQTKTLDSFLPAS